MKPKPFPTTISEAIAADNAAWRAENVKAEPPQPVADKRTVIDAPRQTRQDKRKKLENIQLSHVVERAQEKRLQARPSTGFQSRAVRHVNWGPDTPPESVEPPKHPKAWAIGNAFDQLQFVLGQVRVEKKDSP